MNRRTFISASAIVALPAVPAIAGGSIGIRLSVNEDDRGFVPRHLWGGKADVYVDGLLSKNVHTADETTGEAWAHDVDLLRSEKLNYMPQKLLRGRVEIILSDSARASVLAYQRSKA